MSGDFGSISFVNNVFVLMFKVFVGFGVLIFSFYCWSHGFYPEGISLGDAMLFFVISAFFGYFYSFFLVFLTCIGCVLGFVYNLGQKNIIAMIKKFSGLIGWRFDPDPLYIKNPGWGGFLGAVPGGFFVYVLGQEDFGRLAYLVFSSLVCALSWSLLLRGKALERKILNMGFKSEENLALRNRARIHILTSFLVIVISPITIGEVFGNMVDASMAVAKLRYETVTVEVPDEGVVSVLSKKGLANASDYRDGYVVFDGADLVFHGFGSKSYIMIDGYEDVFSVNREEVFFEK